MLVHQAQVDPATDAARRARFPAGAALLMAASEEARRLIPPVSFAERWTRQPVQVGGVSIPAGEFIGVSILAANRDPETFRGPAAVHLAWDKSRPGKEPG